MKSLLPLLAIVLFFNAATAQKVIPVSTSALTGIALPENTKWDKRFLIEAGGKAQLKNEADKYNALLSTVEIFKTVTAVAEDSIKNSIAAAGWQIYPSTTAKYYWATRQNKTIITYIKTNKNSTDIYFCEAKSNNGSSIMVNSLPVNNTVYSNQNNNAGNAAANGSSVTCGNVIFTVPAGWKLEPDGENYALRLPDRYNDPQRWINLAVIKSTVSSGNMEADFTNTWQKLLGGFTRYQEPYLIKEKSIKGYDIIRGGTNIRKDKGMPMYAYLWVAKVKDKLEKVLVIANSSNDFDITVNTEIKPFWAALQFKNLAQEATGNYSLKGNGIQGIYTGLRSGMTLDGGIAKNISFLIIYEDGKLKSTDKLPDNGFINFDREVDREINADYWGLYDLKKGTVIFNQQRKLGFTYNPPKQVIYNEYVYTKLPAVDALTLSGVYTVDKSATAVSAFGHEPTITFYADGRFEDNTALYYVKTYDAKFKNPGKGKYTINNFTINPVYDDGRGSASFSMITWDAATNSSIQIGGQILLKK